MASQASAAGTPRSSVATSVPAPGFCVGGPGGPGANCFDPRTACDVAPILSKGCTTADEATRTSQVAVAASSGCGTPDAGTSASVPGAGASEAADELGPDPDVETDLGPVGQAAPGDTPGIPDDGCLDNSPLVNSPGGSARFHLSYDCTVSNRAFTPSLSPSGTVLRAEAAPFCTYAGSGVSAIVRVCLQRLDFVTLIRRDWVTPANACRVRSFRGAGLLDMTLRVSRQCKSAYFERIYRTILEVEVRAGVWSGVAAPALPSTRPALSESCGVGAAERATWFGGSATSFDDIRRVGRRDREPRLPACPNCASADLAPRWCLPRCQRRTAACRGDSRRAYTGRVSGLCGPWGLVAQPNADRRSSQVDGSSDGGSRAGRRIRCGGRRQSRCLVGLHTGGVRWAHISYGARGRPTIAMDDRVVLVPMASSVGAG